MISKKEVYNTSTAIDNRIEELKHLPGINSRFDIINKWGPAKGETLFIHGVEYRVHKVKGQEITLRPTGMILNNVSDTSWD